MTGVSGSGKSSLAFDTIFAEGQAQVHGVACRVRARQFLDQLQKPHVESIEGLPPTIAIEQAARRHNLALDGRDHDRDLRLHATVLALRARRRAGTWMNAAARSVASRSQLRAATQIVDTLMDWPTGTRHGLLAGGARGKKGFHREVLEGLQKHGFVRARVNGRIIDIREALKEGGDNPLGLGR